MHHISRLQMRVVDIIVVLGKYFTHDTVKDCNSQHAVS